MNDYSLRPYRHQMDSDEDEGGSLGRSGSSRDENEEYDTDFEAEESSVGDVNLQANKDSMIADNNDDDYDQGDDDNNDEGGEVEIFLDHVFDAYDREHNEGSHMKPPLPLGRSRKNGSQSLFDNGAILGADTRSRSRSNDEIDEDEIEDVIGAVSSSRSSTMRATEEAAAEVEEEETAAIYVEPAHSEKTGLSIKTIADELSEKAEDEEDDYLNEDFEFDDHDEGIEDDIVDEILTKSKQQRTKALVSPCEKTESGSSAPRSAVDKSYRMKDRIASGQKETHLSSVSCRRPPRLRDSSANSSNHQQVPRNSDDETSLDASKSPTAAEFYVNSRPLEEPRYLSVSPPSTDASHHKVVGAVQKKKGKHIYKPNRQKPSASLARSEQVRRDKERSRIKEHNSRVHPHKQQQSLLPSNNINSKPVGGPRYLPVLSPAIDAVDANHHRVLGAVDKRKEKYGGKPNRRVNSAVHEQSKQHRQVKQQSRSTEHRRRPHRDKQHDFAHDKEYHYLDDIQMQRLRAAVAAVHKEKQRYKHGIGGYI